MSGRLLAKAALLLAAVTGFTAVAEDQGRNDKPTAVRATANSDATEPRRVVPRKLRVLFITARGCDKCERELKRLRQPGGEFEAMRGHFEALRHSLESPAAPASELDPEVRRALESLGYVGH